MPLRLADRPPHAVRGKSEDPAAPIQGTTESSTEKAIAACPQDWSAAGHGAIPWLLGGILLVAPLFRSGRPPLAVLAIELLSTCLLVLVLWRPSRRLVSVREALALTLLLALPLLYLVPLPAGMSDWLPGRQPYLAAASLMGDSAPGRPPTLSLNPLRTESALLLLVVPTAVFLATRLLGAGRSFPIALLLLGVGAAEAVLGVLQYGASHGSPSLLGIFPSGTRRAVGTYTNPDHLAGLLEMLLPVALALMFFSIGRRHRDREGGWRERLAFVTSLRGHVALAYGALALVLLVGVVFTRSRGGISLGILGIALCTIMFSRRIGGSNVYGATGTLIALAIGCAVAIGLVPVLDRFSVDEAVTDARWTIFSATLSGVGSFAPLGSGPGTYSEVFTAFQPIGLGHWFINHAHNDYLEWLFEGGLANAGLIALLLALYVRHWPKVWAGATWSRSRFVQVGAGIAILLMLLHSLVDFNLHIPANIAYFAFLAGLFFSDTGLEPAPVRRKRRRTPHLETPAAMPAQRVAPESPPDQIRNPFLDDEAAPAQAPSQAEPDSPGRA